MEELITLLLSEYGLIGIVFVALGGAVMALAKRIKEIQVEFDKKIRDKDKLIIDVLNRYHDQSQKTSKAIFEVTSCLMSIKKSLDRMELSRDLTNIIKKEIEDSENKPI